MKKFSKNILFPIVLVTSFCISGCKEQVSEARPHFIGVHDFTALETDKYLIRDGVSDYVLLVSDDPSPLIRTARDEFNYFYKEATGKTLDCFEEDQIDTSALNHFISIGETEVFKNSGLTIDKKQLGNEGIRIMNKDDNIYIVGGTDSGSLYGVYDFLTITFNYAQYAPDYFVIDRDVKNQKLLNYDVTDIPDIPMRANGFNYFRGGSTNYDYQNYGNRMRQEKGRGYYFMPVFEDFNVNSRSVVSTNTNTYIPYSTYSLAHPDWFSNRCSTGKYQLCYSCHGNASERELLVQEVAKKIKFSLKTFDPINYPNMSVITFTMEDNFNTCACDECKRLKNIYGAESGVLNVFVNDVGELIEEWMNDPENEQYKRDDFHIIFFAYNAYEEPPVIYNSKTKKYEPTVPEVRLRDNVGVYFAEINSLDYQRSLFHKENEYGKKCLDGWCDISDFVYYWTYETNFAYSLYFYDTFDFFNQEMYNYVAAKNLAMFFGEAAEFCGSNGVNWNGLKGYLDAKLGWDTNINQSELMDDYFANMYGDAQYEMREFFNLVRANNAKLLEDYPGLLTLRSCYNTVNIPEYYPLATCESFLSKIDHAKTLVEKIKYTNPSLYKTYIDHIELEGVSYLYIMLELHGSEITKERKREVLNRLKEDAVSLSIETMAIREAGNTLQNAIESFESMF